MLSGLILTDAQRLAAILSSSRIKVIEAVSQYVLSCESYINWQIVDVSDEMYADLDKSDWHTFASILEDNYIGLGLQGTSYSPLFIIGGDDVVPMPLVSNPLSASGEEFLYSDMPYSYDVSNLKFVDFVSSQPRFAVGRLPLTRNWDLDGLVAYLEDCVVLAERGIHIRGAAMTTTQSWLRASNEMMKDIPTVSLSEDYVPLNNRMIVSPDLDTEYKEMYDGYVHELKKVDFLVCNLHGSDREEVPYFLGEDSSSGMCFRATQPSMMSVTAPYIFNTVACYGGRYIGYDLKKSMLLTAMAYGTMLYCGSCHTAYGGEDRMEGNSELLMKLYNVYLHKGIPAGSALLKAKIDYYCTCHYDDGDEYAMYTILEFNLFGCPILSMQPKLSADYEPVLLGRNIVRNSVASYNPKTVKVVSCGAYRTEDIHSYVRSLVDDNLSAIRKKVEAQVYQRLGLGKENLSQVLIVYQNGCEVGYRFLYERTSQYSSTCLQAFYVVNTDIKGEITKIIHTK